MDNPPIEIRCEDDIIDISLSKVDNLAAVVVVDGSIELHRFDNKTDKRIRTIRIDNCVIRSAMFTPDATKLFCGCDDGFVMLISVEGKVIWKAAEDKKHGAEVSRVFVVNDKSCFSGDQEGGLKLWDPNPSHPTMVNFTHHQDYISDFDYNEKEDCVVVSSADGSLSVISLKQRDLAYQTSTCNDELLSCCVVKNGMFICAGTQEGDVNIYKWDEEDDVVDRITGHPESIDGMLKVDEDTICTGSDDGVLRVVQVIPNQFLGVVGIFDEYPVERMDWSFDHQFIATSSHDNILRLFDMSILKEDEEEESKEEAKEKEGGDDEKEKEKDSDEDDDDDEDEEEEKRASKKRAKKMSAKNLKHRKVEKSKKKSGFFDDL